MFILLARTEARSALVWPMLLGALTLFTAPAYASTYASASARAAAVQHAGHDASTLLLYGVLPMPGTPAQMFVWEIGAYMVFLAGVAALLAAVRLTRGAEDSGAVELVRATGASAGTQLCAVVAWLFVVGSALGLTTAGALWARRASLAGFDTAGAMAYGATVALTYALVGVASVVLAQVAPTATGARRAGTLALAVWLALRAWGDLEDHPAATWLSPLGLRGLVRPFTDDRLAPVAAWLVALGALVGLALLLGARRDPGRGLIRARESLTRRLRVTTLTAFSTRLALTTTATWAGAVALGAGLFTAMGSGVIAAAQRGDLEEGFLADQLRSVDPAAAYLGYVARVVGVVVAVFVVLGVQAAAADERAGTVEHVRATGCSPSAPLRGRGVVAAGGALVVLAVSGCAAAVVARVGLEVNGAVSIAMRTVVCQWPASVALGGAAMLLVGCSVRCAPLAWLPLGLSALATMLGGLLRIPEPVARLSVFGHAPDGWQLSELAPSAVLLAVGLGLGTLGLAAVSRRDASTG
ncbi:hypothetical protein H9L10_11740 [Phycicoccus endophyticus]|uniref:ABC transporter permease n=1 Tax=Phycicoccus endophyticus TaxID=1690220 RepID=A0A7G9R009_9MICO|nr:hypothetical protein [Phycicoccus endophyticus]NHI20795.1 hypothetical protein [Phycicoccus endophyticus]QNN48934.1 hypothetical protein H9L10_11740 [Phycicoccus endophyticus]